MRVEDDRKSSEMDGFPEMDRDMELTYNWVDITKEFFNNIQDLKLGELLHDGQLFGLLEAMSAIEMMEPKMDTGMLCNRGNPKPLNFQQAVEAGKLKIDKLEPSELIGIIDATMACIVSWLEGHSLAQTVFTNLYLHQPHSIVNKTLKAYCIAVYKLLDVIRECINKAQVFEEEDFQPVGYGFRLGSNPAAITYDPGLDVTEQACIAMLREQEEEVHRMAKSDDPKASQWAAVGARIKLTRTFYQALSLVTKREQQSGSDFVALLNACSDMMKIIIKTQGEGTQPIENSDAPNPMGFEPMINQRLMPPTFPRYTRIKPRPEALKYWDELVHRLRHAWKITSCTLFHTALDFFMEFSRQRACILSRSALQLLYLSPSPALIASTQSLLNNTSGVAKAQKDFLEIVKDSARSFVNPPVLAPKSPILNNPQVRDYVEGFLSRCVHPFATLLQISGHNRARQRDKLAALLNELAALQEEAENVDSGVGCGGACFETWLLYHTLRIVVAYLLSGLELELYSVHEYYYIFWYLYEFLYGWLVSALGRAEALATANGARRGSGEGRRAGGRRNKKRAQPYAREALMCQIYQNLCGGYFKALVAFKLQGKIPQPTQEFDSEAVRYKHRFGPLAVVTPPLVHYTEFVEMTRPLEYENPLILYLGGCKHFQQARSLMESITTPDQEVTDLLRVAKTNFVVLKLLAGGHKSESTTPPDFDFTVHRHFPIIRLV